LRVAGERDALLDRAADRPAGRAARAGNLARPELVGGRFYSRDGARPPRISPLRGAAPPSLIGRALTWLEMGWVDEAAASLRSAGYRPGTAGRQVLEHLASQQCCLGAKEIHEDLCRRGRSVGLASVYRMLDALSEQALVQRVDVGDGVVRYEPSRRSDHHHHLVCEECGKVEPFADRGLERALEAV